MHRGFWKAVLGYTVITMAFAAVWHLVWFKELYHQLGIYNRSTPIVPLGLAATLISGVVLSTLYPRFYRGGHPITQGVIYGLAFGAFAYSYSTLALGAKATVTSLPTWLGLQMLFHVIHSVLAGAIIGLSYGRTGRSDV